MMTAYMETQAVIKALQEGAYDYLRKPFEIADLNAVLNRAFEKVELETGNDL